MRALVLTDWWTLEVREVPDPRVGPGDVLLEVLATGICGSDVHGFTGDTGRRVPGQIMGHETVGRIAAIGAEVYAEPGLVVGGLATVNPVLACGTCRQCLRGREQACATRQVIGVDPTITSAFAERMVVRAENVVPLPADMPVEYGALVEPLAVGYHALRRGDCRDGDTVLVLGGGPIGQACILAAGRLGAQSVLVSEPDAHRRRLCEQLGAASCTPDEVADAIDAQFGGGPGLVVDAVGVAATLQTAFAVAPLGATVVLVGMGEPTLELSAFEVSTKERSLVGSFCYSAEEFRATAEWVGGAPAQLAALVEGRVGLDGAADEFSRLAKGTDSLSKVLVMPQGVPAASR